MGGSNGRGWRESAACHTAPGGTWRSGRWLRELCVIVTSKDEEEFALAPPSCHAHTPGKATQVEDLDRHNSLPATARQHLR